MAAGRFVFAFASALCYAHGSPHKEQSVNLVIRRLVPAIAIAGLLVSGGCCPVTGARPTVTPTAIVMPTATSTPLPTPTPAPTPSPTVVVPKEVPDAFRSLYAELRQQLDGLEAELPATLPAAGTIVAADLNVANSNRGPDLLAQGGYLGILNYLSRLADLNARGVTISINYPLLLPETPRYREYINLYRVVAQQLRGRKVKLHIRVGSTPTDPGLSRWLPDYEGLALESMIRGRRQHVDTILREFSPDYLTIVDDPAVESQVTGVQLGVAEYTRLITSTLQGLDRRGVWIGACVSPATDPAYLESLLQDTSLDLIDLRLDSLAPGTSVRLAELASSVRRSGKRLIIGEAWLSKAVQGAGALSPLQLAARDTFGFWQPLDARFVTDLVRLARFQQCEWVSFAPSRYFFGYLDYVTTPKDLDDAQVLERAVTESGQAAALSRLTETGMAFGVAATRSQ